MATTKVARESGPTTGPAKPEPNSDRARLLIGEAVEAALHTYEQAVANFAGFEHKAAEATRSDRAKAALNLHATFIEDLTAVYMRTARAAMR